MTFTQAKDYARKGIKVTHEYFTEEEYMTMKGNMIIFEDGTRINVGEWVKGKSWLLDGWSLYIV
jgi:hypothetical protein